MKRSALAVVLAAAICLMVVTAGCGKRESVLGPNLPPETSLFVQGPVDKVNHRVHLYWFGSDPDGYVVAYHMRFVPTRGDTNPKWDTLWCAMPGRCTDSVFTVPTGDSSLIHTRFEIRAMDDKGAVDPEPAKQPLLLSNLPPQVNVTSPYSLGDTTFASVTTSWDVVDPDGGGPGLHYRIWLDGNRAGYDSTTGQSFTVPSSRFIQNQTYLSGPRTLSIQAVDDGGSSGPPATMTWYVRAPAATLRPDLRGELLIIDDVPSLGQSNSTYDEFYLTAVTDFLAAGRFGVLRPELNPRMFRSARDFAQTLRQFKTVLWYRGQETTVSSLLGAYQDSLEAYLDAGGNLYLDGLYLIQGLKTVGALTEGFAARHLRSAGMYNNLNSTIADSTAGWSNKNSTVFRSSIYGDVMRATFAAPTVDPPQGSTVPKTPGIRAFIPTDTSLVALWAMESQLSPRNVGFEAPVGISAPQAGGGRLVFLSLPIRVGAPVPAGRLVRRMLFGYSSGSVSTPGLITP